MTSSRNRTMNLKRNFNALPRRRRALLVYTLVSLILAFAAFLGGTLHPGAGTSAFMGGIHRLNAVATPLTYWGLIVFCGWELSLSLLSRK